MKIFILSCILVTSTFAFEAFNFSARFGGANVSSDDYDTSGTGYMLQGELFINNDMGVLLGYGASSTETDDTVSDVNGNKKFELTLENSFTQAGVFYYLLPGLRASVGLSFHDVSAEETLVGASTQKDSDNYSGMFYSLGYAYPIGSLLLGVEYNMQVFDEYQQSGFFLLFGLLI